MECGPQESWHYGFFCRRTSGIYYCNTFYKIAVIENKSNIDLRPDFADLDISCNQFYNDSIANIGSRDNLIGKNPSAEKIKEYSNEMQVTEKTPPSFLVHAADDDVVNVENSIHFFEALQRNHVLSEIHIYPKGGHGFGMNNHTTKDQWMERLKNWMDANGWLKK